ncbi:MAG: acetyl-CoA carboxylase carboxyltransferase subunit alpha [Deltaproteobacteria bacterium]|nr:acetyl-CoA carboxylase carboxyltransferase subunit alpha [Deltaproteobacteria bacterium]MBZ0219040.1 acetyl-CoA carboxylase carboxyltransferase subunit alpha [Deltaproteobacteria bacterium]
MYRHWLEFEKPVEELEKKIDELRAFEASGNARSSEDIAKLEKKTKALLKELYGKLTPQQITQVARHPYRPYTLDYIQNVFEDFIELHGDRTFRDDPAIVGGLARLEGEAVVVLGQQKGRNTKEKVHRNFGMPNPEGYRKAKRLFELAERFNRPVFTFIDTPGAYPGVGAEERGQSEAIATNLMVMSRLKVPVIATVIGEGGSGGALAIGVADRVNMMEFSTYSVISPEGCAAILWKDGAKADLAAKALKIDAGELLKLGVIDKVIKEPVGGAHREPAAAFKSLKSAILPQLKELKEMGADSLVEARYRKYRSMGFFSEPRK